MKTLLALSFFPAFVPPRSGGETRLFNIYRNLSERYRVILISSSDPGSAPAEIVHSQNFTEVRVPKGPEFEDTWAQMEHLAGKGDLSAPVLTRSAGLFNTLHQAYLDHYPECDAVIHECPFLVDYDLFFGWDGKPRIYSAHNVEADLYAQLHAGARESLISRLVSASEERLYQAADLVLCCTQQDGARLSALYGPHANLAIAPNGVAPQVFDKGEASRRDKSFVFLGSGHLPNVQAVQTLVDEIAPVFPDWQFDLIGACAPKGQVAANVTAHGLVSEDEKRRLMRQASFAINPLSHGGGSSLKVADFAASGLPIISTEFGVRGFAFERDVHYFHLDLADVRTSVQAALGNRKKSRLVARQSADHIRSGYTWDKIANGVAERIEGLFADAPPQPLVVHLNDFDAFTSVGGGATRVRGVSAALAERAKSLYLCFSADDRLHVGEMTETGALKISVPKTQPHIDAELEINGQSHISSSDIVAAEFVAQNPAASQIYAVARRAAAMVVCEHPYMTPLPRAFGDRFVYSSHNFELGLKRELLQWHPSRERLLATVANVESFAVGCSALTLAVSDEDGAELGEAYPISAPIVTVPNGAALPAAFDAADVPSAFAGVSPGRSVVFLGSGHIPNVEAAQFIVDTLAPSLPRFTFHFIGSVCDSVQRVGANVRLWGTVSETLKSAILSRCGIAINPMVSGSGSNVKVADYLLNGLHVLSTDFGARGYEDVGDAHLTRSELSRFGRELNRLADSDLIAEEQRAERREAFAGSMSMHAHGRRFAELVMSLDDQRPRVLYTSYRYNFPRRGGGEIHVNRLIEGLADNGFRVDVLAPAIVEIEDYNRFQSAFMAPGGIGKVPTGHRNIRVARLPVDEEVADGAALSRIWAAQPDYEKALFAQLSGKPGRSVLTWGWGDLENGGRWTFRTFGLHLHRPGRLELKGLAAGQQLLTLKDGAGEILAEVQLDGHFSLSVDCPAGGVSASFFHCSERRIEDHRPLGAFMSRVEIDGEDMMSEKISAASWGEQDALKIFEAHHAAYRKTREGRNISLSAVRGPKSSVISRFLEENIGHYDLLVTHNAVFRTATEPLALAKAKGVPSLLIPHSHLEDDYYHFEDIYRAYEDASCVLASPKAACEFLDSIGVEGVHYHTPGIDAGETFTQEDVDAFREVYDDETPFFLVLGRKAGVKGYRDVIAASATLARSQNVRLVMIGPDDDGAAVVGDHVTYLGLQDRAVVRGALAASLGLVNMSQSESFGIVILEAWLAGVPVIANRSCAAFRDLIDDGVNGYLATPGDLAKKMKSLMESAELRASMAQHGRALAMDFDWSCIVTQFVDQCTQLING